MRLFHFVFCAALFCMPSTNAQSLSCSIPVKQSPCNYLVSELNSPQVLPPFAFNPIHLGNGSKHLEDTDLYPLSSSPDLSITRHYDSSHPLFSTLGSQWRLSYDVQLKHVATHSYLRLASNSTIILTPEKGVLKKTPFYSVWQSHLTDQRWFFDQNGWLIKIEKKAVPPLIIERHNHPPLLHQIKQIRQGDNQLDFHYIHVDNLTRLDAINSPHGQIKYKYEKPKQSELFRLIAVLYPDQRELHYHYEPAYQSGHLWAITGKSIRASPAHPMHRVRSWIYNQAGQAIFMMAEHPSLWARLDYTPDLSTNIHSPQGLTTIHFSDHTKSAIRSVSGANCWGCPPSLHHDHRRVHFASFSFYYDPYQKIRKITGDFPGWPQLALHYDPQGQLTSWSNQLQNQTLLFYDSNRPSHMIFANGDKQRLTYNAHQQVQKIHYQNAEHSSETHIYRPSTNQRFVDNGIEKERLTFNKQGQIHTRHIERQITIYPTQTIHWNYQEHFNYDEDGHLIRHQLPEGGSIEYLWKDKQLEQIRWINRANDDQLIMQKVPAGYFFANGTYSLRQNSRHGFYQYVGTTTNHWWQLYLRKNALGLIKNKRQYFSNPSTLSSIYLTYNSDQQIIAHHNSAEEPVFYAWHLSGELAKKSHYPAAQITRDQSGLPTHFTYQEQNYILRYNPSRQLHMVYSDKKIHQKNLYNAAGFRVYTQNYPQEEQRFFLYHQQLLTAEFHTSSKAKLPIHGTHPISRRYIYHQHQPVAMINYEKDPHGELLVMHSDHLGAVHIISNLKQQILWQADYDIFGQAHIQKAHIDFHLRRTGQYYDSSTGWHQNVHRIYIPTLGQFLEPEPLGPTPTSQLIGYVKQQPLNHYDPLGLLLFSFDGTRYNPSQNGVIYQFSQGVDEPFFYHAGPGTPDQVDWDAIVAYNTQHIINTQWQRLLSYLQQHSSTTPIPIDIVGFSRGAAMALHFANQVLAHTNQGVFTATTTYGEQIKACIQPRFMGLLDTVAQMGILGSQNYRYNFSVSPAWQWVTHGVALHEYRFIMPVRILTPQENVTQNAFIGSHADLGGGYPSDDLSPFFMPLSHVTLAWLRWHAQAQGLSLHAQSDPETTKPYAYLHDESSLFELDRRMENHGLAFEPNSDIRHQQNQHPLLGHTARQQVQQFLNEDLPRDQRKHNRRAVVDLPSYYRWLEEQTQWSPH